jgi:hypothetical protein
MRQMVQFAAVLLVRTAAHAQCGGGGTVGGGPASLGTNTRAAKSMEWQSRRMMACRGLTKRPNRNCCANSSAACHSTAAGRDSLSFQLRFVAILSIGRNCFVQSPHSSGFLTYSRIMPQSVKDRRFFGSAIFGERRRQFPTCKNHNCPITVTMITFPSTAGPPLAERGDPHASHPEDSAVLSPVPGVQ